MDRGNALIYQQNEKSHYNKYFIELACSKRYLFPALSDRLKNVLTGLKL